ncbi:MAG: O-methyltransferase, partial [Clostridia bacterium]|nr:O-methyltransferase [Clostridia bacterium]
MNISYDYITDYICKTLPESTGLLKEMENFAKAHYVPIIQKETMHFLKFLMSVIKPEKILEIGTAIGYSSLVFSQYLKDGGKIITVELDEDMAKIALENFKKAQNKSIKLIIGDGGDVLLNTNEKFDVVFLDANKSLYLHSLPDIKRILKKGGVLIADNVLYKGMVASGELETFRKKTLVKNLRDFLYEISNDG